MSQPKNDQGNNKTLPSIAATQGVPVSSRPKPPVSVSGILKHSALRALDGGISGALAMGIQVFSLMWLRTTMNYQYRYGTTTTIALKTLYKEGGVLRFYRGLTPALVQGPLSRFGDTAANTGVVTLLDSFESTKNLPIAAKTGAASVTAGLWRIFLMPVDAVKTIMQVEGKNGFKMLTEKVSKGGPTVLYHGALAASGGTIVGHFPWFFTYNFLDSKLPKPKNFEEKLLRQATMGFVSSVVSDTSSNSIRVIKTTKQTAKTPISYPQAFRLVVDKDGYVGLFGRGLKTRILANGLQGLLFSVLWRLIDEQLSKGRGPR